MTDAIQIQIDKIFDANRVGDLNRFIKKRQCLNFTNMMFSYLFHIVQTSGIIITTVAAGYNEKYLVWVGAGISSIASLIKVFEGANNAMLKKLLNDIKAIKNGTYIDEGLLVDDDKATAPPPAPEPPKPARKMAVDVPTRPASQ